MSLRQRISSTVWDCRWLSLGEIYELSGLAALLAVALDLRRSAAIAYVAGTMGCLFGADIFNLGIVSQMHAPVASIGGAGTFDGVFLSGLIAVLLA
jgi:uncharacterized membrane protein